MLKDMPVGDPKRYNVKKGLDNLFGYALVKVKAPSDLYIPVLPVYAKINEQIKMICPTGEFKGYYFSEILKYAVSLGYEIEMIDA